MAEHHVSYAPTEEQELIRSTARHYLEERIGMSRVRELMMTEDGFERPIWKEIAEMGWPGLAIDEQHGGAGMGPAEMSVLLEEMGRQVTPGPFFASAVLATNAIACVADPEHQAALLPALASGDQIATLAMFEKGRGWSVGTPATTASAAGSGFTLDGEKRTVLDGHLADLLLVSAAVDDGVGVFAVDPSTAGVTVTQEPALDPTRRQARVRFESVALPSESRLSEADATGGLDRALALGRVALAAEMVGGAQRCMEMSVDYAKSRHQFGRPIGSYQSIKHRCANMLMKVEHARSAAYYAARVTDDPEELAIAAPLTGSVAAEAYVWVAGENIQVHGGIGFTWEHDAHIYLKRAKSSSLLLGSPAHQRDLMGAALGI